jgi:polysaccharide deacetylase 2 family uncharacterized protein YibQ
MLDDLTRPLGLPDPAGKRRLSPVIVFGIPVAAIVAAAAIFVAMRFGGGGNPPVVARITGTDPVVTSSIAPPAPQPGTPGLSEVKPTGKLAPLGGGDVVIHDPNAPEPVRLAALPRNDLLEPSNYGSLPRIGADGTRPIEAYKRPADPANGMFRVAIVVGGIGLSEDVAPALASLPGAVTLGVAPYGRDMAKTVADARAAGHEILLQVPLEPYGYPDVNPGPKTLTTDAPNGQNLDRLRWLMSRATTYVGVVSYMGGRFSANADKLAPVLSEIGKRGLLYLDDGTAARSQAGEVAGSTPFLQADIVLDADTDPAAIDARLDDLVSAARSRGWAIATGSAFPSTIDRIAAFAKTAASHGILIVPITALLPALT